MVRGSLLIPAVPLAGRVPSPRRSEKVRSRRAALCGVWARGRGQIQPQEGPSVSAFPHAAQESPIDLLSGCK